MPYISPSADIGIASLRKAVRILLMAILLPALLVGWFTLPAQAQAQADQPVSDLDRAGWTAMSSRVYDAAPIGDDLWLAQDGGLTRWNIEDGAIEQITQIDGLPHAVVYSVVVDEADTLWLSGNAGVSRRDAAGAWTHYASDLPPIAQGQTLALGSGGDLWVGHGTDEVSQVSRLTADGEWIIYASIKDAVAADFAALLTTINRQSLWSISYGEVWSGFDAYDGSGWTTRLPPADSEGENQIGEQLADSAGNLYAPQLYGPVWKWNGTEWSILVDTGQDYVRFFVTPDGSPWYITKWSPGPWRLDLYNASNLITGASAATFAPFQPFVWADDGQVVIFDPALITQVAADEAIEDELPAQYGHLNQGSYRIELRTSDSGDLYVGDSSFSSIGSWSSRIRRFDTTSPPTLKDDRWTPLIDDGAYRIVSWEISQDDSVWSLTRDLSGSHPLYPASPPRQRSDTLDVSYPGPPDWNGEPPDNHLWIVDPETVLTLTDKVHRLHNNGTPTDFSDDRWTNHGNAPGYKDLVEDSKGFVWVSASFYDGATQEYIWAAYRYHEPSGSWSNQLAWSPLSNGDEVYQLAPAQDGTMFFVPRVRDEIIVIWPDFTVETLLMSDLATEQLALLRTTERRNTRWVVDPDGVLWFTRANAETGAKELVKHSETETTVYAMSDSLDWFSDLVMDAYGHIWRTGGDRDYTIWRFSPLPDFALMADPAVLLIPPEGQANGALTIDANAEFSGTVSISVTDVPQGIDIVLGAQEITLDAPIPFTVSVSADATGSHQLSVTARSRAFVRTKTIFVVVFDREHANFLPTVIAD